MYVEYCNYNRYIKNYDDELKNIFGAIECGVDGLALPIQHLREIYDYLPRGLVISTTLDYPLPMMSTKARISALLSIIKSNINTFDYVPNDYLVQIGFKKYIEELTTIIQICKDHGCTLRVFLQDERMPSDIDLIRRYNNLGIDYVFPSIGYHRGDIYDCLIYSKTIQDKLNMNVIFNQFIWRQQHLDYIKKANLFGLRLYNTKLWCT